MMIQVSKKITNTDIKYKILTAGAKFDLPVNTRVTVIYEGKSYTAKTHSTTVGRIDGLSAFYNENSFNAGDELFVSFDQLSGEIFIDKSEADWLKRLGDILFNTGSVNTEPSEKSAEICGPDESDEIFEPDVSFNLQNTVIPRSVTAEKSELGIDDSESWKNLRYEVTPRCYSPKYYPAAANSKYIVFHDTNKLVIFNRQDFTYMNVPLSFKDESLKTYYDFRGYVLTENDTFYWADNEVFYKTDIHTGYSEVINRFRNRGDSNRCYCASVCKADEKTIVAEIKNEKVNSYMKLDINGEIFKIPPQYAGSVIAAGAGKLLIKGKELWVFDVYTKEFTLLIDYALSQMIDMNRKKEIAKEFDSNFFAVDFRSNTVTVRDFEGLTKGNYKKDSLIKIRPDGAKRLKRKSSVSAYSDFPYGYEPYKDCSGHEVGVDRNYCVTYKNPDGSFRQLFYTLGAGVPEGFKMVDDHTAVVKINHDNVAILDFSENCKYVLPLAYL